MSDKPLRVILDENIPEAIFYWLKELKPNWIIENVFSIGLGGKSDDEIYTFAVATGSIVITFDEDFADARFYPLGQHAGVIRLRVWPTSTAETKSALIRLTSQIPDAELRNSLVIVHRDKIRIRRAS